MFTATMNWPILGRLAVLAGVVLCGFAQSSVAQETKPASPPTTQPTSRPATVDPPTKGITTEESDPAAVALADITMKAMGGRQAWDETRYIAWNFFGSRRHIWDKHTGNVRIEFADRESGEPIILLMNINTLEGRGWRNGNEVADSEALTTMLKRGQGASINDSYWLLMPYKLKDPGVTLKYIGEKMMEDGRPAEVVQLTFTDVGNTPQNKYHVYIAKDTQLIEQWDFFSNADDSEPGFKIPWRDWKRHGRLMLSGDRGERSGRALKLTDIAVFD
ncbi:MAG: hypothetical protein O6933_03630 [Planctomycetota bacterium]|nr:hypothetical protein [Planctomycetota bacterium]